MGDVAMVALSLSLIVLTWTVVKINERIGETQRMIRQINDAKDDSAGSKAGS